jgi:hypothetical protein
MQTLTYDKISGITAPKGQITGFPTSHVRSFWPTAATTGKFLSDKRIAFYQTRGYYTSVKQILEAKKQKRESSHDRMARLLRKYK